ncbi:hypothetical protein LZK98_11245 [Sphingomonas cannabina]|uniref:hypothetical protein n=1 Tax=Sphingomonas cannabina TaxID=2899123 RepID=UPI001F2A5C90|nr:hypothetical protein [Sphingomonas cannabina]UIJ43666.1 hypothetical protein LZK98_11245 [Sphingomonas cannabina]
MAKTTTETKAGSTRRSATSRLSDSARGAVEAIEANPVAAVAGGLAIGLVIGALIPRGTREKEALRPVGKRIAEGAKAAVAAARETGKEQLDTATASRDAAKEGIRKVLESAVGAARGRKENV